MLQWLTHTDAGLSVRIAMGCVIFAWLAWVDFRRNASKATRWREYVVLLCAVSMSMLYGMVNDQITVTISPEYFLYGKELYKTIGDDPGNGQLRWEAAKIGLKATWSVGLIFGVMLLLANNPFRTVPRLGNRQLLFYLQIIFLFAAVCGTIGGCLGYHGYLTRLDSDFIDMVEANVFRPRRFMSCWGVHLGGYVGGAMGAIIAVISILHRRLTAGGVKQ